MNKNLHLFSELTGKSKYKGFFGVYIFIHKISGHKYVGSSNLLRQVAGRGRTDRAPATSRMYYYFKGDFNSPAFSIGGKFLPLLKKDGLEAFSF